MQDSDLIKELLKTETLIKPQKKSSDLKRLNEQEEKFMKNKELNIYQHTLISLLIQSLERKYGNSMESIGKTESIRTGQGSFISMIDQLYLLINQESI